jgi:hypothetical protein
VLREAFVVVAHAPLGSVVEATTRLFFRS